MCFEEGYEAKKKVLVADDDGINRRVLRRILSREYQVVEACNGQEALEMLSEDRSIAAVLLDLHMPVMDGYELLDVIRSDEKLYQLPVLALTAADANTAKEQVIRAGADDFLIKPVAPSVMLRRLETAILLQSSPDQGAAKILDALPFGVWLFDETTGQRIYANRKAAALDVRETVGLTPFDGFMAFTKETDGPSCTVADMEWKGRRAKLVTREV